MKEITPITKVAELLELYPELEESLIQMAPAFKKLKNPFLRKTVAKVTNLSQAAVVGGVDLGVLINTLREKAGLKTIKVQTAIGGEKMSGNFSTESIEPTITYDAREDLANGVHPITKVLEETRSLDNNGVYLLITPFIPAPLIEMLEKKGFETSIITEDSGEVKTFVRVKNG